MKTPAEIELRIAGLKTELAAEEDGLDIMLLGCAIAELEWVLGRTELEWVPGRTPEVKP